MVHFIIIKSKHFYISYKLNRFIFVIKILKILTLTKQKFTTTDLTKNQFLNISLIEVIIILKYTLCSIYTTKYNLQCPLKFPTIKSIFFHSF